VTFDPSAIASWATAAAVLIAAWQLHKNTRQACIDFEDDLSREYRELARTIPGPMLLGETPNEEDLKAEFSRLYQYIDLSNEQVFLRMAGRITKGTWLNWRDGIQSNLSRPAFARAWNEIKIHAPGSFTELRRLEDGRFVEDPRQWVSRIRRFGQWFSA